MYLFSPFLHLNDCSVKKSMGTPLSPWTTVYISMSCWSDPPNSWEESWPIHPHRQRTSTRSGYWAFLPIHPHRRRTSTRVRLMGFLAWPPCFVFCWNTVEFQSRLWLSHLKKKKKGSAWTILLVNWRMYLVVVFLKEPTSAGLCFTDGYPWHSAAEFPGILQELIVLSKVAHADFGAAIQSFHPFYQQKYY